MTTKCACWQDDDEPSAAHSPLCSLHSGCSASRCCLHEAEFHDEHGCTVDVSSDPRAYARCHGDGPYSLVWARQVVKSIPRPTPAEQDAAALDYAETRLTEITANFNDLADIWDRDAQRFSDEVQHFIRRGAEQIREVIRGDYA